MSEEGPQVENVPDGVGAWIDERAEECGLTRTEFLRGLAAALDDGAPEPFARQERVSAVEDGVDEKIQDVRDRVLQVKREADRKADADHEHPELERAVAATDERIADLATAVEDQRSRLDDVESRVDDGFENFEEVLDYLTETTDDLGAKTQTLATALLDVRDGVRLIAQGNNSAVDQLAAQANRKGVREAACEDCARSVDIALLREPACPHCGATFSRVESKSGWFGSHTLQTGESPPALEPGDTDLLEEEEGVVEIAGDGGEDGE